MDKTAFVETVQLVVEDGAVRDTISILSSAPPGREPDDRLVELSAWFNHLSFEDRQNLERVIQLTAYSTLHGFLCILDGVRFIESTPSKGHLSLYFHKNGADTLLNDDHGDMLHDLLRSW